MAQKTKNKILIVDDDSGIRDIYSIALSAKDFDVITAVNGEEGLEKSIKETPDLILLDISMPVMDGLTMLKKLRATNDYAKKVKVILLTNLSAGNEDIIKGVVETEPDYYIVKSSLSVSELVKKVKEVVGSKDK